MTSTTLPLLFTPIHIRGLEIKNRLFVSPMCQYSAEDGVPNAWHLVHLGSRAVGGAGLVMVEATGVNPKGRISAGDLGLWNEKQAAAFEPITQFIKEQGSVAAIQLAHAGRKASTAPIWLGGGAVPVEKGGWVPVGPGDEPFNELYNKPQALTVEEIAQQVSDFENAAKLSLQAGFQVVEIHMAHGYLLHEFLTPLVNSRTDQFGGSLENRMRFPLQVAEAVRKVWPQDLPVFVRISATDWTDGGWDLEQSIELSKRLKAVGVDLIDCSTGGAVPTANIPTGPNYQVHFAEAIRKEAEILTGAVGLITDAKQAEAILQDGEADAIFLAREFLRDPYFPLHAATELGVEIPWPKQYKRARPSASNS